MALSERSGIIRAEWGHVHGPPTNQGRTFGPRTLAADEVTRAADRRVDRAPSEIRRRALVSVLSGTGRRLAETLARHQRDVATRTSTLPVRIGKTIDSVHVT